LTKEELDITYTDFLDLADKKKEVNDDDLLMLVGQTVADQVRAIKVESLQVICGKSMIPTATVTLNIRGDVKTKSATGDGPVDAAFSAIKKIITQKVHLEDFLIQAITGGSEDLGKVTISIRYQENIYYGFGANTDIVTASVDAFVDAISKTME
jgi:2-isopropylmalate synthase